MPHNESRTDRMIRAIAAPILLVLALVVGIDQWFGIVLGVLAVVMAVTAAAGFCPLYRVFGISTCKVPRT